MRLIEKCSDIVGRYMAVFVLAVSALSLFMPRTTLWIRIDWINYLLMIVMLGMGLTISWKDFAPVFTRPRDILTGCVAQFTIMPGLAWILCKVFHLDPALTAGVVLVGTCPGGTASNVMTYLAGGDVALSVGMTSVNTMLAPLLTPAITYLLLRTTVHVDVIAIFLSIIKVVLLPIAVGFIIQKVAENAAKRLTKVLPLISTISICMIIGAVVSHNSEKIFSIGAVVFGVVILHNVLGYGAGYGLARLLRMSPEKTKAFSFEIGMQNSGLATSLAGTAFPELAMATVPGAAFSIWHNISGALLAGIYRRWK